LQSSISVTKVNIIGEPCGVDSGIIQIRIQYARGWRGADSAYVDSMQKWSNDPRSIWQGPYQEKGVDVAIAFRTTRARF
jgi:hypothetical protein